MRFGELQRAIPDISQKMLTVTLRTLEQDGIVHRRAYAQLYTLKKDVIAANKASYHDFFVSSLERHDVFSAHEYLKKDILFMEDELLGTGITT